VLVSLSLLLSQDNMTTAKCNSRTPSAMRRRISATRTLVAKVNPKES